MMENKNSETNHNNKKSLMKYLLSDKQPDYAFLIDGSWGAGKTFFVQDAIENLPAGMKDKCTSISLHGISDINFLYEELVLDNLHTKKMHNNLKKLANGLVRATLKKLRIDSSSFTEAILNYFDKSRVYIFDDVERCGLKSYELLGLADKLIRVYKSKVIFIAYQQELLVQMPDFLKVREKVVGKSIDVKPSPQIVLSVFLSEQKNESLCTRLFESNCSSIIKAYEDSTVNNLRLLKRAMHELIHLFNLSQKAQLSQSGNEILAYSFTAFYLERHGGVAKDINIDEIGPHWFGGLGEEDKKLASAINEKYGLYSFSTEVLPAKAMLELASRASLSDKDVIRHMEQSPYSIKEKLEKSWRSVWYWSQKNAEEVEECIDRFEADWDKNRFLEFGDIMHAVGIQIWLARKELRELSLRNAVQKSKKYIDQIYFHDRFCLEFPYESININDGFMNTSYDGLGFFESESNEFIEVKRYLSEKINSKLKANVKKDVLVFYRDWTENPQAFLEKISRLNRREGGFSDTSFFVHFDAYRFYRDFLKLHAGTQLSLMMHISIRHRSGSKAPRSELVWLRKFVRYVYTENLALHKIDRERMKYMYRNFLEKDQINFFVKVATQNPLERENKLMLELI